MYFYRNISEKGSYLSFVMNGEFHFICMYIFLLSAKSLLSSCQNLVLKLHCLTKKLLKVTSGVRFKTDTVQFSDVMCSGEFHGAKFSPK